MVARRTKQLVGQLYGLTELGNIVKLSVREERDEADDIIKVIDSVIVLNLKTSKFTDNYIKDDYGDIVKQTISSNPKDIFDRLSHAKQELEKKELALMRNLFIIGEYPEDIKPKIGRSRKKPEIK
jgi:hypothetical protein